MLSPELAALLQRLAAAEAQIAELRRPRRRRAISSVVLVATLAVSIIFVVPPALHAESNMSVSHEIEAPFSIVSHGSVIFQVKESLDGEQRQALLFNSHGDVVAAMLSIEEKGMVTAGDGRGLKAGIAVDADGNGSLDIRDNDRKKIALIQKTKAAQGLVVYRPASEKIAIGALASGSVATINVRDMDEEASGIVMTHGASLQLNDEAGGPFAALNSGDDPPEPGVPPNPDKGRGLFIYNDKGDVSARSSVDKNGNGFVAVKGTDESEGLLALKTKGTGAELILTGPHKAIGAELTAAEAAGLYLYSPSGVPFLELNSNEHGGRFWLGDTAATGMIEAGVTDGGRGVLRAGPRFGGPIELTGLPFAVLGKK
jgi:hypothetical protein